jgi:hypothetical protein
MRFEARSGKFAPRRPHCRYGRVGAARRRALASCARGRSGSGAPRNPPPRRCASNAWSGAPRGVTHAHRNARRPQRWPPHPTTGALTQQEGSQQHSTSAVSWTGSGRFGRNPSYHVPNNPSGTMRRTRRRQATAVVQCMVRVAQSWHGDAVPVRVEQSATPRLDRYKSTVAASDRPSPSSLAQRVVCAVDVTVEAGSARMQHGSRVGAADGPAPPRHRQATGGSICGGVARGFRTSRPWAVRKSSRSSSGMGRRSTCGSRLTSPGTSPR